MSPTRICSNVTVIVPPPRSSDTHRATQLPANDHPLQLSRVTLHPGAQLFKSTLPGQFSATLCGLRASALGTCFLLIAETQRTRRHAETPPNQEKTPDPKPQFLHSRLVSKTQYATTTYPATPLVSKTTHLDPNPPSEIPNPPSKKPKHMPCSIEGYLESNCSMPHYLTHEISGASKRAPKTPAEHCALW